MIRISRETTRTGQSFRSNVARRRQSPPKATPKMIPAATPLASMSVADNGFLRQSAAKLGKRLVFDLGPLTCLEGGHASRRYQCIEGPHDFRIKLARLVPTELIHRSLMTDGLSVNAVGGHRFVRVGNNDDSRS